MSDLGRKDLSSKVEEKVTPDSTKSDSTKVGESLTGAADKVASVVVPDSEKSTLQSGNDSLSSSDVQSSVGSTVESAKQAISDAIAAVTGTAADASEKTEQKASDVKDASA